MPTLVESPLADLRERVRSSALNRPGVYRMMGRSGVVIYVGKSKRVRTRLLGYFRAREEQKAWRIVREARQVEWEYQPSEFASLLHELELIKRYRPQYNVRQKRDALYSYLKLTAGSAPKFQVVRRITGEPGSYFGPFRGGERITAAVRELNDALKLRDCRAGTPIHFSNQGDLFGATLTPLCSRFELQRCSAPCAGRCSEESYGVQVENAIRFLSGAGDAPVAVLAERMRDAAERWEYEHATALRDRIDRLETLQAEVLRLREALGGLTFLYAVPGFAGEHQVYAIRSASIRGIYPAPRTPAQRKRLIERAREHFERPEGPGEESAAQRVEQILLIAHWFRTRPDEHQRAFGAERWARLPLSRQLDRLQVA